MCISRVHGGRRPHAVCRGHEPLSRGRRGAAAVGGFTVAARVVVRDEEESAVPLWRRAQRLVDVLEEPLALGDVVARVVARLGGRVEP
eukprot:6272241-Prymnesium_polylepis.1